ncbi:MAG: FHA domain-containing protein [Alphaproteobacteria bacterium]
MGSLVVGRDGSCDIVLDDSSVSRWHVKLDVDEEGACRLTDLGSTNGTFVFKNREPVGIIEALVTLADRVKIGKCDFSVRELVSLARDAHALSRDLGGVKATETLAQRGRMQFNDSAPRGWRPSSAFTFVVGFSVTFWLVVLYLVFGF